MAAVRARRALVGNASGFASATAAAPAGDTPARDDRFRVVPLSEYSVDHMGDAPNEIIRHLLYTNAYGELEAVEVLALVLADAADTLPRPMRAALYRQLWDEARHAAMSVRRMDELGGAPDPLPPAPPLIHTVMDGVSDPLDRLIVLQRVIEGRVVERHRMRVYTVARELGDPETARLYEFIVADERTHVANSDWVPRLVGDDPARLAGWTGSRSSARSASRRRWPGAPT